MTIATDQLRAAGHRPRPLDFIAANMRIAPLPGLPAIRLYATYPASGLWRLAGTAAARHAPPYWAYPWAGGTALARHLLERPETVAGRRVLDLGAGSGLVGIAAALAGAGSVMAADTDPNALAAIALNAAANGVDIAPLSEDVTSGPPPEVDLVLAGDVFYQARVAQRMTAFFDRCLASGIEVLIGDPYRAHLPLSRLQLVAEHAVPDVGSGAFATVRSGVFAFGPG